MDGPIERSLGFLVDYGGRFVLFFDWSQSSVGQLDPIVGESIGWRKTEFNSSPLKHY